MQLENILKKENQEKKSLREKLIDWSVRHTTGTKAKLWLGILSFSEASFFLVPPDVLLIAILVSNTQKWVYYASFATVFSVLGGLFGYLIGFLFFDFLGEPLIALYSLQDSIKIVAEQFNNSAFLTIFLSAFTPIPYKLFTISAGFFKINIFSFITASILGRGMRFFAVSFFMKKFGARATKYLFKYLDVFSVAVVVLIVLIYFLFR